MMLCFILIDDCLGSKQAKVVHMMLTRFSSIIFQYVTSLSLSLQFAFYYQLKLTLLLQYSIIKLILYLVCTLISFMPCCNIILYIYNFFNNYLSYILSYSIWSSQEMTAKTTKPIGNDWILLCVFSVVREDI